MYRDTTLFHCVLLVTQFSGILEVLLALTVHFLLNTLPVVMIIVPFLIFDLFIAFFSLIYFHYKLKNATKRRAKLLQQLANRSNSVPIPGRSTVPCNIIAQQIPLTYCYKSTNKHMQREGPSYAFQSTFFWENFTLNEFLCVQRQNMSIITHGSKIYMARLKSDDVDTLKWIF